MGYYFIHNLSDFEKIVADTSQVLWIGDHAFEIYHSIKDKGLSKFDQNLSHQLITYDSEKNRPRVSELTVLNETFPLWEEHYTLPDLIHAFIALEEDHLKTSNQELILIGNPGELIAQGFMNFLLANKNRNTKQIQVVLLKDEAMSIAFHQEIIELEQLLIKHKVQTIEVAHADFDWNAYFNMFNETKEVKKNSQRNFYNHQ